MILLSDSGSTKTDWLLTDGGQAVATFRTQGINPFMLTADEINNIICQELIPQLPAIRQLTEIQFYGAGCKGEQSHVIKEAINTNFPGTSISVNTDMLCAARALCGHNAGIACILGTGANSCHYDGTAIVDSISPLGYILGDEGSGAMLGKVLVANIFKRLLPQELINDFTATYHIGAEEMLHRVYKKPLANRFLASFTPFLKKHEQQPAINKLLAEAFDSFFQRNIFAYKCPALPVSFVGGIAYAFREQLAQAAQRNGMLLGKILRSPLEQWENILLL